MRWHGLEGEGRRGRDRLEKEGERVCGWALCARCVARGGEDDGGRRLAEQGVMATDSRPLPPITLSFTRLSVGIGRLASARSGAITKLTRISEIDDTSESAVSVVRTGAVIAIFSFGSAAAAARPRTLFFPNMYPATLRNPLAVPVFMVSGRR